MKYKRIWSAALTVAFLFQTAAPVSAQAREAEVFDKTELLQAIGDRVREKGVRLKFLADRLEIEAVKDRQILKSFKYADIKDAEYSYSKNPRWKTGLGLGAAGIVFPPLLLIALPVGLTKHRRHWLTVRTENDYAVVKLSKSNRKLILPAFETRTGVKVAGRGESK